MSTVNWQYESGPEGDSIPVARLEGGEAGPSWLLTGGVHGDEYEGPEAVRRVVGDLAGANFAGTVIALPVVNPRAYSAGTRCTPSDGGNLNRLFPGKHSGTWSSQWAAFIWEQYAAKADHLIDLHSGGVATEFETVAGFHHDDDQPLAATFGIPLWRMPATPGVFSYEFRQQRGPALGLELAFGGKRHEFPVELARVAIVNLVRGTQLNRRETVHGCVEITAEAAGEWTPHVQLRQRVSEGSTLGTITDWTGQEIAAIRAPQRGIVLAIRTLVSVTRSDMVAMLGMPESKRGSRSRDVDAT